MQGGSFTKIDNSDYIPVHEWDQHNRSRRLWPKVLGERAVETLKRATAIEDDVAEVQQFDIANIDEEHFAQDPMAIEIAEEIKRVSQRINIRDFKLLKVLGRGAFGKVVLVEHKEDNRLFALKTLRKAKIIKTFQVEHTKAERT